MGLGQGAAEHGEVLREHIDQTAVDVTETGDDAVAHDLLGIADELVGSRLHEPVELGERALVQEEIEPLAHGHLALRVLLLDPPLAAALQRPRA